ncbi:unnamed protein product [Chrysodeixis includens]|uniref:Uncharacterized protein n=1 Tax=Chrysodeixis includens TaxID=689277 RepID=A0A9N8PX08_CHRIL|nr:unnamed protein product [Chrysodeixis includens]
MDLKTQCTVPSTLGHPNGGGCLDAVISQFTVRDRTPPPPPLSPSPPPCPGTCSPAGGPRHPSSMHSPGSRASRASPDSQLTAGSVELREDLPLKAGAARARCCAGGPRLILAAFAVLTAAITLALLTQIYYGDYEEDEVTSACLQVVPHGSVSSSAAACSRAGTDALKAGGRALDAAAAAALCLAVLAPHRTSFDASGSLLYWEYREARTQPPVLFEWGGEAAAEGARAPRLLTALATLHAQFGALPWHRVLAPALQLASEGFLVSEGLSAAEAERGTASEPAPPPGANVTAPALARYLQGLLPNTSAELAAAWGGGALLRRGSPLAQRAGAWRVLAGGAGGSAALRALVSAFTPPPASSDDAQRRALLALQSEAQTGAGGAHGVATGLAVVDQRDTYIALVTGLSVPFGSGPETSAGWTRDEPTAPLDLAPALMLDDHVCGTRYVLGAESGAALAQTGAALGAEGAAGAVERARVAVLAGAHWRGRQRARPRRRPHCHPHPPRPPRPATPRCPTLPSTWCSSARTRSPRTPTAAGAASPRGSDYAHP